MTLLDDFEEDDDFDFDFDFDTLLDSEELAEFLGDDYNG